jgi:hypothetical protein
MGFAVRVHRQWWLSLIVGIVVMLGAMAARVSSNTRHPPLGLTEVSPTIPSRGHMKP